jgi:hypothetical protein
LGRAAVVTVGAVLAIAPTVAAVSATPAEGAQGACHESCNKDALRSTPKRIKDAGSHNDADAFTKLGQCGGEGRDSN